MDDMLKVLSHDAFRYGGGLNASAGTVYWYLLRTAMTAKEIAEKTGMNISTVHRALKSMKELTDGYTGERMPLVQSYKGRWSVCPGADLETAALIVCTSGSGRERRERNKLAREAYRRLLREKGTRQ